MRRTLPVVVGLVGVLLCSRANDCAARAEAAEEISSEASVVLRDLSVPSPTDERPSLDDSAFRPPLVVVRGLGHVPDGALRMVCRTLLDAYPVRCEIRPSRSLDDSHEAWDEERGQLDARRMLDVMFASRAEGALAELDVTTADIFEENKPYVFGLASLTDRVALISLHRIGIDDPEHRYERLAKLALHEAGHTFGLHHHDDVDCVMRQDPTVASLDTAPPGPCAHCRAELRRRAEQLAQPGRIALDRARGYLVRGQVDSARDLLAQTLARGTFDRELLESFAVAFIEARQANEAISVLRYLLDERPEDPSVHANLGVAYQVRDLPGDRHRAIRHLRRALDLRPQWTTVANHLADLSDDARAQGPS